MNRDRESRPRLVSDGSFFGDSFSNLEIDDNVRILHNLGLDPAGNISPALAFQHDRDSRDRDRDNIRIFLKSLELWVSVRFCAMWRPDVTPSPYPQQSPPPLIPPTPPSPNTHNQCCKFARQKFRPKSSKRATKKKFLAEFWLILPKTGRKGAAENIQKMFLIFSCDNCDKFDF